jgi:formylglycine-generating enzyme required for sulfatase activity
MMRAATRHHLQRTALAALAALAVLGAGSAGKIAFENSERARRAEAQLEQLWSVAPRHLPALLDAMEPDAALWRAEAERVAADSEAPAEERARASFALARLGSPPVGLLSRYLENAAPEEQRPALEELRPWAARLAPGLWEAARDDRRHGDPLLAVASALAAYDPDSSDWDELAPRVASALVEADPLSVMPRVEQLAPARGALKRDLLSRFDAPPVGDRRRLLAASILARYAADVPGFLSVEELVTLALKADSAQLSVLDPLLLASRAEVASRLEQEIGRRVPLASTPANEAALSRQANAAQVLLRLGRHEAFWPRLLQTPDPRLRTLLIDRLEPSGVGWEEALSRAATEPEPTIRQAIVLGLDPYFSRVTAETSARLVDELFRLHRDDPDGGVHMAAEWLLRHRADRARLDEQLAGLVGPPAQGRDWFLTPHGHTMLIVRPRGEFVVGSPDDEPWRDVNETRRVESIDYTLAVSAHEITIDQFLAFRPDHNYDRAVMPSPGSPAGSVSWFDAIAYCRWLSEQTWADVEAGQIPYPTPDQIRPGMSFDDDYLRRDGYRLPTALEWEYLARSRAATSRFFGNSDDHLARYAWFGWNSGEHPHPVGLLRPSPDGLFDLYGNLIEWCDPGSAGPCPDRQPNRGGNFRSTPRFLRASMPNVAEATDPFSFNGFRIVRPIRLP